MTLRVLIIDDSAHFLRAARSLLERQGLILISTHDPDDFAELVEASPAVGFLSKSDLSAQAILDLVGGEDAQPASPGGG